MPQPFTSSRKPGNFRDPSAPRRRGAGLTKPQAEGVGKGDKAEHEILFQTYFKSVGPRTYAAQIKRAANDNQYLVLTEGKRDDASGEVRKTRLFVFSEDFPAFFRMLHETAVYMRANPVPEEVKQKRQRYWARKGAAPRAGAAPTSPPRPQPKGNRPDSARGVAPPPPAATPAPKPAATPVPPRQRPTVSTNR